MNINTDKIEKSSKNARDGFVDLLAATGIFLGSDILLTPVFYSHVWWLIKAPLIAGSLVGYGATLFFGSLGVINFILAKKDLSNDA